MNIGSICGGENDSYRSMMGEYIIYYRGKVIGGIYDDRFLVKPTKTAAAMMPDADLELPYEGAKGLLPESRRYHKKWITKLFVHAVTKFLAGFAGVFSFLGGHLPTALLMFLFPCSLV